jgi:hypothetical protein
MTKDSTTELRQRAVEILRANAGNISKATAPFCALLRKRADLLAVLADPYLARLAAEVKAKPIAVRAHRRQRKRTATERAAAMHVAGEQVAALRSVFDRQIDGRPIGDLAWGELRAMVHANAVNAASYLRLGTNATEDAILLDKIEAHARVDNHATRIREIISAAQLEEYVAQAQREAPRLIELGMKQYAATIETRRGPELAP